MSYQNQIPHFMRDLFFRIIHYQSVIHAITSHLLIVKHRF